MADPGFRKEPGFLLWGFGKGDGGGPGGVSVACRAARRPGGRWRRQARSEAAPGCPGRLGRRPQALARACAAASLPCSSGMIFAAASSPARIAALRCVKSLALIAARFGRITTSAYLSSS